MKKDCNIGNVRLANPFLLAPLAGVTDAHFAASAAEMGAGLVYSEMVSAKGLWYKDKNTDPAAGDPGRGGAGRPIRFLDMSRRSWRRQCTC